MVAESAYDIRKWVELISELFPYNCNHVIKHVRPADCLVPCYFIIFSVIISKRVTYAIVLGSARSRKLLEELSTYFGLELQEF